MIIYGFLYCSLDLGRLRPYALQTAHFLAPPCNFTRVCLNLHNIPTHERDCPVHVTTTDSPIAAGEEAHLKLLLVAAGMVECSLCEGPAKTYFRNSLTTAIVVEENDQGEMV